MAKMNDDEVKTLVRDFLAQSTDDHQGEGGKIVEARKKSLSLYRGDAEAMGIVDIEGRSKITTREVFMSVQSIMPDVMRVFTGGDDIVKFIPDKPGEEKLAEQETAYVNWAWSEKNESYRIIHDWALDALVQKLGVIKVWWCEEDRVEKEEYEGLTQIQRDVLLEDDGVELVEETSYPDMSAAPEAVDLMTGMPMPAAPAMLYDVKIKRTKTHGFPKIINIPPEDFIIEATARDADNARGVGHRTRVSVAELIEMGVDEDDAMSLSPYDSDDGGERSERYALEEDDGTNDNWTDPLSREVEIVECFIRADYDGDGSLEWVRVVADGHGRTVLMHEEWPYSQPFVDMPAIPESHKAYGLSIADLTGDLQQQGTVMTRQIVDNLYLSNAPERLYDPDFVHDPDSMATRAPGNMIAVDFKIPNGRPVQDLAVPFVAAPAMQYMEALKSERYERVGTSPFNQGLDKDVLSKTATGAALMASSGKMRIEMIIRTMAEVGFRRAAIKIFELARKHEDKAMRIRLMGEWHDVNPSEWRDRPSVTVNVGLGYTNREQQFGILSQLWQQVVAPTIQMQGGVNGPLMTLDNVYNLAAQMVRAAGFKAPDLFLTNPANAPQAAQSQEAPPPDPKLMEMQAKMELETQKAQSQMQLEQMRLELKRLELDLKAKAQEMDIQMKADRQEFEKRLAVEKQEFEKQMALQRAATAQAQSAISEVQMGGQIG